MSTPVIQTSFNSGEWAPALNARVDLTKYHTGAALLRNFFVDYRGGATARAGTKYILQARSNNTVRLIPFQASFTVSYVLEFGQGYIRFYSNGSPVLESPVALAGATPGPPEVFTAFGHGYSNNDWVFGSNENYYIIQNATTNTFTLTDLFGNAINTNPFGVGASVQRVYTLLNSPYQAVDLAKIKFALNVNTMILCHPNYPPYQLVLTGATNWALSAITFGPTIAVPTGVTVATTLSSGSVNYAYIVTAVDTNGQESEVSAFGVLASKTDIRTVAGTNTVTWTAVTDAVSYNIYRAEPSYAGAIPAGSTFGFMGNVTDTTFIDSNITPDFSQGPPVAQNPFDGTGVQSVTVTNNGTNYAGLAVPEVSFPGGSGSGAAAQATLNCTSATPFAASGVVGDIFNVNAGYNAGGLNLLVTAVNGGTGAVTAVTILSQFGVTSGIVLGTVYATNVRTGATGIFTSLVWVLETVGITSPGIDYLTAPTVAFSTGTAAATATLGAPSSGNPTVPGFIQQRLALMGPASSPEQFNFSQVAAYYNFDVHNPIEADDAIQGTLVSGQLNTIKSMVPQPYGLIVFSDKLAWLFNGGSNGAALSPLTIVANAQAYNGAADLPPIIANDNILYVQAKGSIVRDLVYNYYTQIYTGSDISVLSSHLFYGYTLQEWAWCEEPFKIVWAVRNDGALLSLTFLKEQELIAWAHHDTQGAFKSVATVTETVALGAVDALYTVVQRTINGNTVNYIERMTELYYPNGMASAWCVDAGISYTGTGALTFSGATQLANATVTGIATDNLGNTSVITPFTMPTSGTFTLPAPPATGSTNYTGVTVGLAYTPQLQTLALDLGEPTVQGKRKKITGVTVRVNETLGLQIGRSFGPALVNMKDLVLGNVGTMTNQLVTNLVTGDARTIVDPLWDVPGQYCIEQPLPYPASILGVIPEIAVGDSAK